MEHGQTNHARTRARQTRPWAICVLGTALACLVLTNPAALAQGKSDGKPVKPASPGKHKEPARPEKVEVKPKARDAEIRQRLLSILRATDWFTNPKVSVHEGVVFLDGQTSDAEYRKWAGDLALRTRDVVAVVNRIDVVGPSLWDFTPALSEFKDMGATLVRALPWIVWGLIVLILAWGVAKLTTRVARLLFRSRVHSRLLREVAARVCGLLVYLLGLYLVLRLTGLTRLAVTVLGGTGLIGLALGIAFRDITENFLASLLLSIQQPFREGDLVEVNGLVGLVQSVNSRTTILMTLNGNQVQVPNATVYKNTIRNYTSNPNRREDFTVGIPYSELIPRAQEIALRVLADHPAVLKDPEPWVLVDNLGANTVNLRIYFWLDGTQHSWLKVKSSVIRLVKRAWQEAGVSLPSAWQEMVFPHGVPVQLVHEKPTAHENGRQATPPAEPAREVVATDAEAGLRSEAGEIKDQAQRAWSPAEGENLLGRKPASDARNGRPTNSSEGNAG